MTNLLSVDIGAGNAKRPGFIGVDSAEGADRVCDISVDRLPFDDGSVGHLFSSHCLEHIPPQRLGHVFREFSRVAADGALVELWHPHPMHRDAFIFDHKTFLSEENYYHMCYRFPEQWLSILGARWVLEEVRYNVEPPILDDLTARSIDLDFAIQHYHDVIKELGVLIRVEKSAPLRPRDGFRRVVCNGPREPSYRELGRGPYSPRTSVARRPLTPPRLARGIYRRLRRL